MSLTLNEILTWIIVGGIAGLLAEWLIGGWLFGLLHISISSARLVSDIITAFVGTVVLLFAIRLVHKVKAITLSSPSQPVSLKMGEGRNGEPAACFARNRGGRRFLPSPSISCD